MDRFCKIDVLLLVFDGILRFSEDGVFYEIHPGEYHIQKHNTLQKGVLPSDSPKYLYIHFLADWTDDSIFPKSGTFNYAKLKYDIEEMSALYHNDAPYILKAAKFYKILTTLCTTNQTDTVALQIGNYIKENYQQNINLNMLCDHFSFSKNHIINIFKKEFGQTPITYLNNTRLNKAEEQIIATSEPIENIAYHCGYQYYSHFYRQFVKKNQISPEEFRKSKRLGK